MGRTKTFDERAILDKAMMVFWQHGYTSTTYALLEEKTGLTGRSLINAYGDKDAIFQLVLGHYTAMIKRSVDERFSEPSIKAIVAFFEDIAYADKRDPRNFGCLMVNSIFEMSRTNANVKKIILSFKNMFRETFRASLSAEGMKGAEGKADFLVNVLWGLGTDIRMTGSVKAAKPTVGYVHDILEAWKGAPKHLVSKS